MGGQEKEGSSKPVYPGNTVSCESKRAVEFRNCGSVGMKTP